MTRSPYRPLAWLLCLVAVLAVLGATPGRALAQKRNRADDATRVAKEHFYRGEKLFALGRFEKALEAYEAAFEAKPLPEFLFNIGQCHANLENYDQAIFSLRKFLRLRPNAKNRAQVEEYIAELEKKQAEASRKVELVPKDGDTTIPPPRRQPIYKRWWFWTGVAAVAAAGTAAVLLSDSSPELPDTDLGNLDFGR